MRKKIAMITISIVLVLAIALSGCVAPKKTTTTPMPTTTSASTATIQTQVNDINMKLTNISKNMDAVSAKVTILERDTSAAKITEITNSLNALKTQVANLQAQVSSIVIPQQVSYDDEINSINTSINTLTTQITALTTKVNSLSNKDYTTEINTILTELTSVKTRLTKLETSGVVVGGTTTTGVTANILVASDYLLGMSSDYPKDVNFSVRIYNGLARTVTNVSIVGTITSDKVMDLAEGYPKLVDSDDKSNLEYSYSYDGQKTIRFEVYKKTDGTSIQLLKNTSLTLRPKLSLKARDGSGRTDTLTYTMVIKSVNCD